MTCAPMWWSTWAIRQAVLVIDETGLSEEGDQVGRGGAAVLGDGGADRELPDRGLPGLCQSARAGRFWTAALYLPKAWAEDAARREAAGVPPDVRFATKGELAQAMLARAFAAEVPAAWVTGDEVYGNDGDLAPLAGGRSSGPTSWRWPAPIRSGTTGVQVRVEALVEQIPAEGWQRIDVGAGSKGPRIYDWACARLPYWTEAGWAQWLLHPPLGQRAQRTWPSIAPLAVRRPRLSELARVAGTRWTIEEGFQRAKEIGLDQYEVRRWAGVVSAYHALPAGPCLPRSDAGRGADRCKRGDARSLIPLTVPEVRRLLAVLLLRPGAAPRIGCTGPAGGANAKPRPAAATTNAASPFCSGSAVVVLEPVSKLEQPSQEAMGDRSRSIARRRIRRGVIADTHSTVRALSSKGRAALPTAASGSAARADRRPGSPRTWARCRRSSRDSC